MEVCTCNLTVMEGTPRKEFHKKSKVSAIWGEVKSEEGEPQKDSEGTEGGGLRLEFCARRLRAAVSSCRSASQSVRPP